MEKYILIKIPVFCDSILSLKLNKSKGRFVYERFSCGLKAIVREMLLVWI
jgi:hypothetical protein